ncbi:hypothetical protein LEMLEM_LOCUS14775, partial [Lemmus lemmus]
MWYTYIHAAKTSIQEFQEGSLCLCDICQLQGKFRFPKGKRNKCLVTRSTPKCMPGSGLPQYHKSRLHMSMLAPSSSYLLPYSK